MGNIFPLSRYQVFLLLKYSLYLLVTINAISFIHTDIVAARVTLNEAYSLEDIQTIFSATIDSVAWIALLLVYELETSVIDDDVLNRGYKWVFYGISVLCYIAIFVAALGYWNKLQVLLDYSPSQIVDLCAHSGSLSLLTALDEYLPVTAENCADISIDGLQKINTLPVIFDLASYQGFEGTTAIAWVDVLNASAWLVSVFLIRLDIIMELRGGAAKWFVWFSGVLKVMSYLVLLVMAVYWSLFSSFIDGWDAFLWIMSFIFIEMNLISWQKENQETVPESPKAIRA